MSEIAICTIISKNYLPFARTLAQSFLKYNKGKVFVLLVDKLDGYFNPEVEPFELIEIEALRSVVPDLNKFCFQYTILELNTGIKPFLLEYLIKKYNFKKLIYFDPDILITNSLNDLSAMMDKFSIILTPHLTFPIDDNFKPGEIEILQSGAYNLGFIALSNTSTTITLLHWWKNRLYNQCIVAIDKGLFVDQKWMDLVPGLFDDVFILRHPGYNAAYWNLHSRKVYMKADKIYVNDQPSYFLHFSGFNPDDIRPVSKHQTRFTIDSLKDMIPVFELYRDKLMKNGWGDCKSWPYVFNCFDNGVKIPDFVRRYYLEMGEDAKKYGNPFSTQGNSTLFKWLSENIDGGFPPVTRLMYEFYKIRQDIQQAFSDVLGRDRERFWVWVTTSGMKDYQLDDRFFQEAIASYKKGKGRLSFKFYSLRNINRLKSTLGSTSKKLFGKHHPIVNKFRRWNNYLNRRFMTAANHPVVAKSINTIKIKKDYGVNIAGYINTESGVGEAVRANIRALETTGIRYVLNNVDSSSRQEDKTYTTFSNINPYDINYIHINADQVPVFYLQKGEEYFRGKYNIGYWVWELSDFPEEWLSHFKYFNEIWTASQFCADAISRVSPIPVIRVPHSVQSELSHTIRRANYGIDEESYIFLFMFDFLSYFDRKNPLALIKAFSMAFQSKENVQLVLKCSNSASNPVAMKKVKDAIQGLRVKLIDAFLSKKEIISLIGLADCYVSLHRSEGFGLPLAEAMYLGKPVIATAYSGNLDFMNVNNSFLVKFKLIEIEEDIGPYKAGSIWADPDIYQAAELMRFVYENRDISKKIGEAAAADIRNQFSAIQVGKVIRERMKVITVGTSKSYLI
ncbi:MAG: hypothetical protein A2Z47_04185 [Thermodesulfovibrio sp. RBG_19FT_COMBO_42_12]|nr:MAG: hypothetical protein A2Z47_04185 [Thermodesulfovibrio sp. RBG_19FT_COMBO_42_12]